MWGVFEALISLGSVKRVQRGVATEAGTITIAAVNPDKTVVISVSKGSAGTVAARGTVDAHAVTGSISGLRRDGLVGDSTTGSAFSLSLSANAAAATISGGETDLVVKEYSARLTSSTTLTCDGPVEWQVVEFR